MRSRSGEFTGWRSRPTYATPRSRAAIARIGGQLDGIMRADRPGSDDTVRTSARFSIVAAEWPEVKERLTARLALS